MSEPQVSARPKVEVNGESYTRLPFPPLYRSHIRHCAFDWWHQRYRTLTPKARLVPLTQPFIDYLRADGIVLPNEDEEHDLDSDSGVFSSSDAETNDDNRDLQDETDVSEQWAEVHAAVRAQISELGGAVVPKLNWSAPKDATWISATNSMECRTPNDVYLLLKSSDFVTHDLQHAYDGCLPDDRNQAVVEAAQATTDLTPTDSTGDGVQSPNFHLILRKHFQLNPSLEFRCFVRNKRLIGICQRDLNHFDFLTRLKPRLTALIIEFFQVRIRDTFPEDNYAFDVYVPPPHERVWLVDFNPWDQRTDPLLFSWLELLTMESPAEESDESVDGQGEVIRLPIRFANLREHADGRHDDGAAGHDEDDGRVATQHDSRDERSDESDGGVDDEDDTERSDSRIHALPTLEFRLVNRNDPEAYMFNTPRYSAHKMPRDVVDAAAAMAGGGADTRTTETGPGKAERTGPPQTEGLSGGLREFAASWKELLDTRGRGTAASDSDSDADDSDAEGTLR